MTNPTPPLHEAIEEYLAWARVHRFKPGSGTPRTYRQKLTQYARLLGPSRPVGQVTGQQWYRACNELWADASAETYNLGRRAALSFLAFCRACEPPWTEAVAPKLWEDKPVVRNRARGLPRATVGSLYDPKYPLRERALWSLLYDSSERLSAVLDLNLEQVSMDGCYATTRIKGGDLRYIVWSPITRSLLMEYVGDRTKGPVFLGAVRPWNWRDRPERDRGPGGLCRLTAHRARNLFRELTGIAKPHRVRHARLGHLAEEGMSTPVLHGVGGHITPAMLTHYATPGPETIAALMADQSVKGHPALLSPHAAQALGSPS